MIKQTEGFKKLKKSELQKWKVLRNGVDYRLECLGCGHILLIPRIKLQKMIMC